MPKKIESTVSAPPIPIKEPAKRSPGHNYQLQVGLITVPIKLHAGARADRISFRQLHSKCLGKLKQQAMHCPHCDEAVDADEIVKGYEFRKDEYVLITKEELEAQKPDTSKVIEVESFVDGGEIDPIYFETSHYLAPGDGGARPYMLVRDILRKTGKVAIARAVLTGNTEHVVAIRPYNAGLALHTLFYQAELKSLPFPVDQLSVTSAEMKLAGELVTSMTRAFNPADFSDGYADNVRALVAAKATGKAPKMPERKTREPQADLLSALTASVTAAAKKRRVA